MIPFPNKTYDVIYADPAWYFKTYSKKGIGRSPEQHYSCMSINDICNLPVDTISKPNCVLFLWAIDSMLPQAFKVIESWGFIYKTVAFTWAKKNKKSESFFTGLGYWTRANPEMCLLATRGKPKRISKSVRQLVIDIRREHSRKPDRIRDDIVELCGDVSRIELFARQRAKGWDSWGNEDITIIV
jgi:N6-adenosine-specific RNA methylase IME4